MPKGSFKHPIYCRNRVHRNFHLKWVDQMDFLYKTGKFTRANSVFAKFWVLLLTPRILMNFDEF